MTIVSLIMAERERYVAQFELLAADMIHKHENCVRELLIAIDDEEMPYPYRYLRVDGMTKNPDGSIGAQYFDIGPPRNVESFGFQMGPVAIEVHPFSWGEAVVAFDKNIDQIEKFDELIINFLNIESKETDPHATSNAIHSVTRIETVGDFNHTIIDFGTAPTDAMLDLIDFLANEAMVDKIIITSKSQ